jgi:hypothetical protein
MRRWSEGAMVRVTEGLSDEGKQGKWTGEMEDAENEHVRRNSKR